MFANTLRRQTRRALATTMRSISVPSFVPCITLPMPFSSRSVSRKRMYHWQKEKKQDVPREEEPSRKKEEGLSKIIHPPSRTLILSTIPREATESDLRAVLAPHGKVEFLCIFRRGSGKSRELGLAVFADQSAADAAIGAGLSVAGTPLRVVYGAPDPLPSREVHVASIPTSVTEADLRTALAPFGEIVTCNIKRDPRWRVRSGHVVFTEQSAAAAASRAGIRLSDEITLHVEFARRESPPAFES